MKPGRRSSKAKRRSAMARARLAVQNMRRGELVPADDDVHAALEIEAQGLDPNVRPSGSDAGGVRDAGCMRWGMCEQAP